MNSRKGALELGVNAIVILIIALTVLGIAIAFIIGAFGQVKGKFNIALEQDPFSQPADATTPIKFESETLDLKANSDNTIVVNIYNTGISPPCTAPDYIGDPCAQDIWTIVADSSACRFRDGTQEDSLLSFSTGGFKIDYGKAKAMNIYCQLLKG